ncbi:putative cytochrome P450 [Rosa chinensis]|uniref:Putative cytochrome P450 n=1 Tax=Rosa chinensis TaxID=74649 RepID=A0A2P6QL35_ROSCH|nr:cytochrome P450 714C2 isoform X1 [Rosa chinensis]PRQ34879.1 putative cytochrome P450 [Rosa chinensis]
MELLHGFDVKMLVSTVALIGFVGLLVRLYRGLVAEPKRLRSLLAKQGITGPPQALLLGNISEIKKAHGRGGNAKAPSSEPPTSHNLAATIFPFFDKWRKQFGDVFVFGLGTTQILYVIKPEAVREITTCTSLDLGKPTYQFKQRGPLLGKGILTSNGASWAHQRKVMAPELYMEKVKGMINLITESSNTLVNLWNIKIDAGKGVADIKIDNDLRSFSGDVISRACFGSSYTKGVQIFDKLRQLQEAMGRKVFGGAVPGMRHLPTKSNREEWALEKEVARLILQLVKERQAAGHEKDLLQMILEGARASDLSQDAADSFIVDNCKNIYLAGYETTATSATWCLMLLASNQEWRERIRAEVLQVCQGRVPDADMLRKMKQLTMVIHESLRLYPPVTIMSREAFKDMKFGDIHVPKSVNVWTSVATIHTDPEIWGPDAYDFKPERFANGITGACKLPYLYMPFGLGPRVCLGQNLAMIELKVVIALIVTNFSFSLSPNYSHRPAQRLVVEPETGVDLLMKKL